MDVVCISMSLLCSTTALRVIPNDKGVRHVDTALRHTSEDFTIVSAYIGDCTREICS